MARGGPRETNDGSHLKDADDLIWPAVQATLIALDLGDEFSAAKKLAQRLAQNIDAMTDQIYAMRWLVPELLKVLAELGATPAACAAIKRGGDKTAPAPVSWLEQQRAAVAQGRTKRP